MLRGSTVAEDPDLTRNGRRSLDFGWSGPKIKKGDKFSIHWVRTVGGVVSVLLCLWVISCLISWLLKSPDLPKPGLYTSLLSLTDNSTLGEFLRANPGRIDIDRIVESLQSKNYNEKCKLFREQSKGLLSSELTMALNANYCPGGGNNNKKTDILAAFETGSNIEILAGFAYFLHVVGCLGKVRSYKGMRPFFFFAKDFEEIPQDFYPPGSPLLWDTKKLPPNNPFQVTWRFLSPEVQKDSFSLTRTPVYPIEGIIYAPYTEFFSADVFSGPMATVGGKHITEWAGQPPTNTFAHPDNLTLILDALTQNNYSVVYTRYMQKDAPDIQANQEHQESGDREFIQSAYSGKAFFLQDLHSAIKPFIDLPAADSYNILQLMLHADVRLRVATQGGNAVVSSLTDGDIFVLHRAGSEMFKDGLSYIYPRWNVHGGARFHVYYTVQNLAHDLYRFAAEQRIIKKLKQSHISQANNS